MLTLVTTNPSKYSPFANDLERMRIRLEPPGQPVPELQSLNFDEALAAKARATTQLFGRPVLVDDAGLILDAYKPFPGPLTSVALHSLGVAGLRRLLTGVSDRATTECHIGWWNGESLRSWTGRAEGRIDVSRDAPQSCMLLTDLFVPDDPCLRGPLLHRAAALAQLETEVWELHLETFPEPPADGSTCSPHPVHQCPFCAELEGEGNSIFAELMRDRLPSRIIYEDDEFVLMPPLGQFIEGGLLLLSRRHILSFAYLPPHLYDHLERLLAVISRTLAARWGVPPLIFEHGPAPERTKGVCCVDHAHLNIFPARAQVHPHLAPRMSLPIRSLSDLSTLQRAEFGYLFVQENDGTRRAFDAQLVPTQLVRRIITSQIGLSDRWHWRDYPGRDELLATYRALKGRIHL